MSTTPMLQASALRVTVVVALLMLLAGAGLPAVLSPMPFSDCTGYVVTEEYMGQVISVNVYCSGSCPGIQACDNVTAGDFEWCQCEGGGGYGACLTVKISGDPDHARCAEFGGCPEGCEIEVVQWTNKETGHEFTQETCYCP